MAQGNLFACIYMYLECAKLPASGGMVPRGCHASQRRSIYDTHLSYYGLCITGDAILGLSPPSAATKGVYGGPNSHHHFLSIS